MFKIQWCGTDPYDLLNKFYNFYMIAIVSIISKCGLRIEADYRNQHNTTKLVLYRLLFKIVVDIK